MKVLWALSKFKHSSFEMLSLGTNMAAIDLKKDSGIILTTKERKRRKTMDRIKQILKENDCNRKPQVLFVCYTLPDL